MGIEKSEKNDRKTSLRPFLLSIHLTTSGQAPEKQIMMFKKIVFRCRHDKTGCNRFKITFFLSSVTRSYEFFLCVKIKSAGTLESLLHIKSMEICNKNYVSGRQNGTSFAPIVKAPKLRPNNLIRQTH